MRAISLLLLVICFSVVTAKCRRLVGAGLYRCGFGRAHWHILTGSSRGL
jgi:hypothetical protein